MRRVVVTGVGLLSSIGNNVEQFEKSLRAGRSGIGPITQVDTSRLRFHNPAEIRGFDPTEHFSEITWLDRFAQLAVVAARHAIDDSALKWNDALRARTDVVTGSCLGGMGTEDAFCFDFYHENKSRLTPTLALLDAGGNLGLLADVNTLQRDGVFVPFFGHLACTTRSVAMLALRTNALIVPVCCVWDTNRYRILVGELVEAVRTASSAKKNIIIPPRSTPPRSKNSSAPIPGNGFGSIAAGKPDHPANPAFIRGYMVLVASALNSGSAGNLPARFGCQPK